MTKSGRLQDSKFPLGEALHLSMENIKKRFVRTLITTLGIILGIAFMCALLAMNHIIRKSNDSSLKGQDIEAYQWWLVLISLIVCVVGITNSMLMAVTERTKEIGVYKTLGGQNTHILKMFLVESAILGSIGGFIGAIVGIVVGGALYYFKVSDAFDTLMADPIFLGGLIVGALLLAILLSLLATIYPAIKGARLRPAEALRYEV